MTALLPFRWYHLSVSIGTYKGFKGTMNGFVQFLITYNLIFEIIQMQLSEKEKLEQESELKMISIDFFYYL